MPGLFRIEPIIFAEYNGHWSAICCNASVYAVFIAAGAAVASRLDQSMISLVSLGVAASDTPFTDLRPCEHAVIISPRACPPLVAILDVWQVRLNW